MHHILGIMNLTLCLIGFWLLTGLITSSSAVGAREIPLGQKIESLIEQSLRKGYVRMDGEKFRNYVKNPPRNYSVVLMLTALQPQRQCQVCQQAHTEFTIVANSWRYSPQHNSRLFFAVVDYDEGADVFQSLQINSAPVFLHFPAKGKPRRSDQMDIQRVGFAAEQIARWVAERTDITIRIFRPPNYSGTLLLGLTVLFVGMLLYFRRDSLEFLANKTMWGTITLTVIFCFTSGQMWNHIRGPPFVHRNPQTGQVVYISGGNGYQFIAETYIVFLMHAAITASVILLNEGSTTIKTDLNRRRVSSIAGLVIFCLFFSLILSIFRAKYSNQYPYSFLFK